FLGVDRFVQSTGRPHNDQIRRLALKPAPNHAPVLEPIGGRSAYKQVTLSFTAHATDPEGGPLTFSLVGAPAGAAINAATGTFTWTPTAAQAPGSYTFTVKVTDNGSPPLSDEEAITVTVTVFRPLLAGIGPGGGSLVRAYKPDGSLLLNFSA